MFEFFWGVIKNFPVAKWATIGGLLLIFFGGKNWASTGWWILGAVAVFCILLWIIIEEREEWKRKKGWRD